MFGINNDITGGIMSAYVYKIINKINGKWYIGSHDGSNKNYMGSGLILKLAIKKYKIENFEKIILYKDDSVDLIRECEELILNMLDAANDQMSYNLKNQAWGGSFLGEKNGMYGKILTEEHRYKCGKAYRGKNRPEHSDKIKGNKNGRFLHGKQTKDFLTKDKAEKDKLRKELNRTHLLESKRCPHCCIIGKGPNMTRYHFDNCGLNEQNINNIIGTFSNSDDMFDNRKKVFECPHCKKSGMNIGNMTRWHFDNCKERK